MKNVFKVSWIAILAMVMVFSMVLAGYGGSSPSDDDPDPISVLADTCTKTVITTA